MKMKIRVILTVDPIFLDKKKTNNINLLNLNKYWFFNPNECKS